MQQGGPSASLFMSPTPYRSRSLGSSRERSRASKTRRGQLDRAFEVLARHRAPDTPVVVARAVGSSEERGTVTALADADLASVDMRTLLIVGSSTTTVTAGGAVYTPRAYPG